MERGFKSRCESIALGLRKDLSLARNDPLSPYQVAEYLNVLILTLNEIPGLELSDIYQLQEIDPDAWSAITVSNAGHDVIITNSNHRGGRLATDVMHEIAHLLLGHEPSTMFFVSDEDLAIRGYNTAAEEEASWLAGALLLPREALVHIRRAGLSDTDACKAYGVSQVLLRYRVNMTGVNFQFSNRRRTT